MRSSHGVPVLLHQTVIHLSYHLPVPEVLSKYIGKDVEKEHGFQTSLFVLWFLLGNVYVYLFISPVKYASHSTSLPVVHPDFVDLCLTLHNNNQAISNIYRYQTMVTAFTW